MLHPSAASSLLKQPPSTIFSDNQLRSLQVFFLGGGSGALQGLGGEWGVIMVLNECGNQRGTPTQETIAKGAWKD